MDYLQKKPKWTKYQDQKEPPKIITMLKLGNYTFNQASIIQQEASNNISDEKIMTVMAHVPIKAGDEHNILILPSDLGTDFVSEI